MRYDIRDIANNGKAGKAGLHTSADDPPKEARTAKAVPENEGGMYMNAAINILKAMDKAFMNYDPDRDDMLTHGTVLYPKKEQQMGGVHISIIYGDYFFTEAILKLRGSEFLPW